MRYVHSYVIVPRSLSDVTPFHSKGDIYGPENNILFPAVLLTLSTEGARRQSRGSTCLPNDRILGRKQTPITDQVGEIFAPTSIAFVFTRNIYRYGDSKGEQKMECSFSPFIWIVLP
ncbi:hypothetical protein TNCT_553911 [Trichonephila clavata]|uniref:Uncharacterized protein n=1 Tax=Trichonephila clavata TaxID=2740835 RepID=A0A8X6LKK2_TRICU|nr:hypothetical protein TNCT_553911 [Trichonephila clavata]